MEHYPLSESPSVVHFFCSVEFSQLFQLCLCYLGLVTIPLSPFWSCFLWFVFVGKIQPRRPSRAVRGSIKKQSTCGSCHFSPAITCDISIYWSEQRQRIRALNVIFCIFSIIRSLKKHFHLRKTKIIVWINSSVVFRCPVRLCNITKRQLWLNPSTLHCAKLSWKLLILSFLFFY